MENVNDPTMTAEARALLALVDKHKLTASLVPGLPAILASVTAYVQRSELRMFALEQSARVHAEILLAQHYGRGAALSTEQLRSLATDARDVTTLSALGRRPSLVEQEPKWLNDRGRTQI